MLEELDQLAARIQQLTQLTQRLRQENAQLRTRLNSAEANNRSLNEKLLQASERVEAVLARLPNAGEEDLLSHPINHHASRGPHD